ncbi:TPA: hypothetical protein HA251_02000 [Candidatus Woesearchaeota archaeon]|nr:hypothetical protein [Candidatus Woesearchaeota archaeon]
MDPTPDQVLDALTERYQQQQQAYEHAKAECAARIAELKSTLEQDVERLHNELKGTMEKLEIFGVKIPSKEKTKQETVKMKKLPLSEVYTCNIPSNYTRCSAVAHIIGALPYYGNVHSTTIEVPEDATAVFNAQYQLLGDRVLVTGTSAKYVPPKFTPIY